MKIDIFKIDNTPPKISQVSVNFSDVITQLSMLIKHAFYISLQEIFQRCDILKFVSINNRIVSEHCFVKQNVVDKISEFIVGIMGICPCALRVFCVVRGSG